MKKLVILTGSGISEESGIKTFRGHDGLWEGYNIEDVATPQAWQQDQELVLRFYNERRAQLLSTQPNEAHNALKELENYFQVDIITQNVDDLHERAGSTNVWHLHGELRKVRSTLDPKLIYDWDKDLKTGDTCEKGSQLRPHIVWFGEQVPAMDAAVRKVIDCDALIVIGTSMVVYPAAGLIDYVGHHKPKYIVDPSIPEVGELPNLHTFEMKATLGVPKLVEQLIAHAASEVN